MSQPRQEYWIAHVCNLSAGHHSSTECWCEPRTYWLYRTRNGLPTLVVEHNDEVVQPHFQILADREKEPDWVTRLLEEVHAEERGESCH